jgi:hypothetical protein
VYWNKTKIALNFHSMAGRDFIKVLNELSVGV